MDDLRLARLAMNRAFNSPGMKAKVARSLGISAQAVGQWPKVPAERVFKVSEITGIPAHELRPDIIPDPDESAVA